MSEPKPPAPSREANMPPTEREGAAPLRAPGRFRRALGRIAAGALLLGVFAGATVGGALLALDLRATRRVVTRTTNDALASVLEGRIVIEAIDHLSSTRLDVGSVVVLDPSGRQAIRVDGLHARVDLFALLRSVALGKGDVEITISNVRIDDADVLIERGSDGHFTLEEAFRPRVPKAPPVPPPAPLAPPRQVRLAIRRIEIGHASAHGELAPPRALDGEVNRLVASLAAGQQGLWLDVEQTGVLERGLIGVPTTGSGNYHLRVAPAGIRMWTAFAGHVGAVEVLATADLDGGRLSAVGDVPHATPSELATLVGRSPLDGPVTAHAEVAGELPNLTVSARMGSGDAARSVPELTIDGDVSLASPLRLVADVRARELDPSRFAASTPPTSITADARVTLEAGPTLRFMTDARTEPTTLSGQPIPAGELHVVLDRGVFFGRAHFDEEGAPVDAAFTFAENEGLHFDASTTVASLKGAPRIAGPVDGSARVRVAGVLRGQELDAVVEGSGSSLKVAGGGAELERATVSGRVSGPLSELRVDAAVNGTNMRAGGYDFDHVAGHASGPLKTIHVSAVLDSTVGTRVKAEGSLDPEKRGVKGLIVDLKKDGTELHGKIQSISAQPGGVAIVGVKLEGEGVGAIEASLRIGDRDLSGKLKGQGIDLERLGALAGIPYRLRGVADVDVDIERGEHGRTGHAMLAVENAGGPFLSGVSASITTTFHDDEIDVDGLLRLVVRSSKPVSDQERCDGTIAQLRVSGGKGRLRGPLLDPRTWEALTGDVHVAAEDWNLRCLAGLVPVGLPVSAISGSVTTRFDVSRPEKQRFASIKDFYLRTAKLEVVGPDAKDSDAPAWESRAVNVLLRGGLDGADGRAQAKATLFDGELLADASASITLDLPTLVDAPAKRSASLRASEVSARLSTPRRSFASLATLPAFVRELLPPLSGELRTDASAEGTLDRPVFVVHASGFGLAPASGAKEPSPWAVPVDLEAVGNYDSKKATLDAHVIRGKKEIASASGELDADLHDLLNRTPEHPIPWTGGFRAQLMGAPLGDVPFFSDRDVTGAVSGTIVAEGLNAHPTLAIDLSTQGLRIGSDLTFKQAEASLHIDRRGGADVALAKADFVGEGGGRLDASAFAGITWKDGFIPEIDPQAPADLGAKAQAFRLAAFLPFLGGAVSKLDGRLDGSVRLGWKRIAAGDDGSVLADLMVDGGVFDIPVLGEEFRNARAHAFADAKGGVRIEDIHAEGLTGAISGHAAAALEGLRLKGATGSFTIAEGQEIPITFEGVPLGEVRGQFDLTATMEPNKLVIGAKIPSAHLELPIASMRDAQPLVDNADVAVSHPLGAPKGEGRVSSLALVVNLALGSVRVEQHGSAGIDMTFSSSAASPPRVELTDKVRVYGDIQLPAGSFDVLSKRFEIDHGLVRMRPEDPGNPFVNVTARWDAPDGTRIFVDYVGDLNPITAEKLQFRSSPSRPKGEILAMLSGVQAEPAGTVQDPTAQNTGPTAALVGGALADQVNGLLRGIAPLRGLSTGIAPTQEGALRSSVSYQLGDKVTASASYQGEAASTPVTQGAATGVCISDRPGAACTEVSVEWRFRQNWLVRGSVGGVGDATNSELNLMWQHRY